MWAGPCPSHAAARLGTYGIFKIPFASLLFIYREGKLLLNNKFRVKEKAGTINGSPKCFSLLSNVPVDEKSGREGGRETRGRHLPATAPGFPGGEGSRLGCAQPAPGPGLT